MKKINSSLKQQAFYTDLNRGQITEIKLYYKSMLSGIDFSAIIYTIKLGNTTISEQLRKQLSQAMHRAFLKVTASTEVYHHDQCSSPTDEE